MYYLAAGIVVFILVIIWFWEDKDRLLGGMGEIIRTQSQTMAYRKTRTRAQAWTNTLNFNGD